jgi:hypothetical protein
MLTGGSITSGIKPVALFALLTLIALTSSLEARLRASSAPFVSGDTFRSACDHIFDDDAYDLIAGNVKEGDTIFVRGSRDFLARFFKLHHPKITVPYRLVTNNCDHDAPGEFAPYLDDPKIVKWFAANVTGITHPKLIPIPRGFPNRFLPFGNLEVIEKVAPLKGNTDRPILAYLNFNTYTYPSERNFVLNLFKDCTWVFHPLRDLSSDNKMANQPHSHVRTQEDYLIELSQSKFAFSPRGYGLDCYRTWEALTLGAIPIVTTSGIDPIFDDLPVLIIQDWNVITEAYLNEQYDTFQQKSFNEEKLYADWWFNFIRAS